MHGVTLSVTTELAARAELCAAFCLGASFLRSLYGVLSKIIALAWCNFKCDHCGKMIASATTIKNHISAKCHFLGGQGGEGGHLPQVYFFHILDKNIVTAKSGEIVAVLSHSLGTR